MPRLPTVNIAETLVNELRSVDASVRQRAIWELGQRGNATAIQPLVNSLMEADSQEKSLIFAALTEIGRRSLQPMQRALALGLQDPSPEVRKNAIRDLSRLYDTLGQMSPLLIHATQDPDPEVQAIAQWALGQLNRPAPAPYLESSVEPSSLEDRLPPATP
jgi:HEAT repeat protein